MTAIFWVFSLLMLAQGVFLAVTPERAVRYTLWKTRLIGARIAQPGRGTILFYRIQGFVLIAVALFIVFKIVSE